jgi:hypothetical protein
MGPLTAAAFESGMSVVEELKLLKAQVQDVVRVCNTVAHGDLSQKIMVLYKAWSWFSSRMLSTLWYATMSFLFLYHH